MTNQYHLCPAGLTRKQNRQLTVCTEQAAQLPVPALRQAVEQHLRATAAMQAQNPLVNLRRAYASSAEMQNGS